MPTFFAIDTMAVLYRSYFAMISKPLVNSKGINVSGMFGLTTSLLGILERERPDYLAVASDTPEPTFRHRRYPAYKATREKMPDDLVGQLPYIPRLVEALGLPYLLLPGWEADDIIGTLVRQAETAGMDSYMVTGDKDYMQLIGEKIRMYSARGDAVTITSSEGVTEKLGCVPERVVDLLALTGDSSDNVPGVPGVGPKTAARLVGEYGALENIYAHLDDLKGKLRENLENHREAAFLSRELVTIDTAVPLPVKVEELALHPRPLEGNQALIELFTELEFQRLRDRLISQGARARLAAEAAAGAGEGAGEGADQPGRSAAPPVQGELALFDVPAAQASPEGYYTLKSLAAIEHQLEKWKQASLLVLDTETTGLDYLQDRIIGLSFSVEAGEAYYIPLNHPRLEEHRERVLEL
ncbi:MAG: DNA polymerase I, partial [Deltaproteobacteria bacterium]|nr:DNA polymerase I [Deltaproteobacteria bacterium]